MSNQICQQILQAVLNDRHKIVILAHISLECNSAEILETQIIPEIKSIWRRDCFSRTIPALKLYQI